MSIQIDQGVPLPKRDFGGNKRRKYPFPDMEVGDSFYVDVKTSSLRSAVQSYVRSYKHGKFAVRAEGSGSRCWRIE